MSRVGQIAVAGIAVAALAISIGTRVLNPSPFGAAAGRDGTCVRASSGTAVVPALASLFVPSVPLRSSDARIGAIRSAWTSAPKGICITNLTCSADGVTVDFVTDLPPPYRVGVHVVDEIGYGESRIRPVNYVDTDVCHAFVSGRFFEIGVFVQVYKRGPKTTREEVPGSVRKMDRREWDAYVSSVRRYGAVEVDDPTWDDDPPDRSLLGYDPSSLSVVGDWTWAGFVYTNAATVAGTLTVRDRQPGRNIVGGILRRVEKLSYSAEADGTSPAVGYRIVVIEGSDGTLESLAAPAYSARTNMSEAVLLKRGWLALSSNGRWKYAVNAAGVANMVSCTNAVPYRIYGSGL